MGLCEIIGGGWDVVARHLSENYVNNDAEKARRSFARKRDDLYEGRGDQYINNMIDAAFKSQITKELRKALVRWAKWNKVTARVVNEKATVYSEPAKRTVKNNNGAYAAFLEAVQQDAAMGELNAKLALHEDVWVQYRVRKADDLPVIDVISPADFWAVSFPKDKTALAAIILDQTPTYKGAGRNEPHYRVWCNDETFMLDGECRFMVETLEPWPHGRMPGVLATTRLPTTKGALLNADASSDLIAAHESVWFQSVLLLKESKSANKQTYHTGDTSQAVVGQAADTETDVILPEGVSTQAVDRGMDLSQFRDNADHILERAGANHGLPPSVLHHRDASSGAEIHLRRIPIRELRAKQIPIMRRIERQLAEIQSAINAAELQAYAFNMDGWSMDFGEVQQPMTEMEGLAVFEKQRQLLLKDTIEAELERNPDLKTPEEAWARIKQRVANEVARLVEQQALMALNGGVAARPGDPTPQQNGARGQGESEPQSFADDQG
jgi:hypothetical protein